MKSIRIYIYLGIVSLLLLLQSCHENSKAASGKSDQDYYTVDDFKSVEKFNAHVHISKDIDTVFTKIKREPLASTNIATPNVLEHWKTYNSEILKHERAEYGEQIVISLNASLVEEYGNGWKEKHLRHCLRIAKTFPDPGIVYALRRQLSWTHLSSFCTLKMN